MGFPMTPDPVDLSRRFGGVGKLYGEAAARRFARSHVVVAGIGGVGSWAAEALARSGIGALTLIDLDMIAESNANRQIHALSGEFGKAKVEAMAQRIAAINPACRVTCIEDFLTPDNLPDLLKGDAVLDAIDAAQVKTALIVHCTRARLPFVCVGAAGGKTDPCAIRQDDLARATQDRLLAKIRAELRRRHGFAPAPKKMGVPVIYSQQPMRVTDACQLAAHGLSCAGYGSSACVTAPMGFAAAAWVLGRLAQRA
jgi:tRNA A37 threonylcarbamoyladenosine dehydratase